jgi:CheY-like chemotaxis protein
LRILLADDNRDAVEALALMLKMRGHVVQAVYSGREALRAAGEFRPDAIILDIGMPDMTGYEVARTLRQQLWARSTRLIALTGWGQQVDKDLAQAAGFDLHLTKPADPEAVLAGLAEACAEGA